MKKIVLSLAGIMAAVAFAPEASAVPAFARQTGMACSACHFQSYPALTGFGKAFKSSGFTMMGAQGKVEGEHGLSIPDTLNMAIYFQARYKKTNGNDLPLAQTTNSGRIDLPDEFSLFAGGRVNENIGALLELSLTAGTATGATGVAGFKLPVIHDVGAVKVGVIPFTVAGLGPQYGFDLFATGSTANGRVIENGLGYSASMYLLTNGNASGAAVVANNELFHVSYTPWVQGFNATNSGLTATKLGGTYIRAGFTPSVAGWDLGVGVQSYSGNSFQGVATIDPSLHRDAATIIDFQAQGEAAGMPIGVYGSYGSASGNAVGAIAINTYNAGTEKKSAFGLLADVGVIANTFNVQLGMMRAKTGVLAAVGTASNETDNSLTVGVRYKLAQNAKLGLAYSKFSGTAYTVGNSGGANGAGKGNSLMNIIFSTAF